MFGSQEVVWDHVPFAPELLRGLVRGKEEMKRGLIPDGRIAASQEADVMLAHLTKKTGVTLYCLKCL